MSVRICMFLWNHFTNDARVLREAETLSDAGYQVDVIAIHDNKSAELPKEEFINENFRVKRVNRILKLHAFLAEKKQGLRMLINNKRNFLFMLPLLSLFAPLLCVVKILVYLGRGIGFQSVYMKVCIFIGMIREGLSKDYEIYHSHDLNTLLQGYICKLLKKKILVYDSHEVQTSRTGYKGKKFYYFEKFLLKRVDKMIMTDDMRADYTVDKYGITRPDIVHNYPVYKLPDKEALDLHSLLSIPKDEPILLYQGGMQVGRGLEKIVEVIPLIKRGVIVFIGDGKLKNKIVDMCVEKGVANKVRFLKKVPVRELLHYTCNAYLGFQVLQNVCFNHYSTTSNKLFEYIMCEVPVIASDFPEIKKVVNGEKVGLCVDPHNSLNIANAVNYMLEHEDKYLRFKENCKTAREKYNWNIERKKFIDLYGYIANCSDKHAGSGVLANEASFR